MLVPCMKCYAVVRVIDDPTQIHLLVGQASEFWPDKYDCLVCGEKCEAISESDAEPAALARMKLKDLSAQEYYAALHGLGTPDEMKCDAPTVNELLSRPVKKVVGRQLPNTERFLLETIEVEGGVKLHFGAGAAGAVIYRITRPISYTEKVLRDG
jgi:hypothetical protein